MAATAKLYGIATLAVELDKDRRTIAKALRHVPADGRSETGDNVWYLKTAIAALEQSEGHRGSVGEINAIIIELEYTASCVDEFLNKLRAEPDIEKRRAIVKSGEARCVGALVRAVEKAHATQSEARRVVERPYIDNIIRGAASAVFGLCHWTIADDDDLEAAAPRA
jgi:hypothetical protein